MQTSKTNNIKKLSLIIGLCMGLLSNASATKAAMVNDIEISVKEVNTALKSLTKGKQTWETLPDSGKIQLIQMLAPSKLVAVVAKKEVSRSEKESAYASVWMQKSLGKVKVSDKEAKKAYNKMKKIAKKTKSKKSFPSFDKLKKSIKMQLAQEKVIKRLIKKAKIVLK